MKSAPKNEAGERVVVGAHPGLWEVPAYCVVVPPALRKQVGDRYTKFKSETDYSPKDGKVTGLDYNLWIDEWTENHEKLTGFTAEEYLATLKYSLDQRLAGNRAPFCFGAHTPLYDSLTLPENDPEWGEHHAGADIPAMRKAMEEFIAYALTKPEVRLVTQEQLVHWMENPAPLK